MRRKSKNRLGLVVLSILAGACIGYFSWYWPNVTVESMETSEGAYVKFRTSGEQLEVYRDKQWQPYFVKGVNMGASLPGHYPGELPITKEDYLRWFAMIQDMGANVIRVYTIHQPVFYEALVEYNRQKKDNPLYFIQGVWTPEEALIEKQDAFLPEIREEFRREIADAVGAVYGNVTIPEKSGKASGRYRVNAGQYLLAWHIGTEWDPVMVKKTNQKHQGEPRFEGEHFQAAEKSSPFESWLAEMINYTAELEARQGWRHPMTFTNWVTTDPLTHPGEPMIHEDMVSVDPTHIKAVDWQAGYFASYHVYPYYPDFFRHDQELQQVKNESGQADSYKAYLQKLKAYHTGMPIMVTEFGVPSSLGVAHIGNLGRNQGGHNEKEQGEVDAELLREIYQEGYAGAILFAWQDEWFKKTWNTMKFELPEDRRSFWLNVLTNESMFGLLGMYPGKEGILRIDGREDDWEQLKPEEKTRLDMKVPGFEEIWMTHDEAYVYVLMKLTKPFDPSKEMLYLGADTIPGGNRHGPELPGKRLDEGLEALVVLGNQEESEVKIASNYDFHTRLYGKRYGMIPVDEQAMKDDSGLFVPWKLAVSLEMEPPDTKEYHPFEDVTVGKLRRGTTDPEDPAYDSLAMWQARGQVVELRIPWMLLGFTDPSSHHVMSYRDEGKGFVIERSKGIRLIPWIKERNSNQVIGLESDGPVYLVTKWPIYLWPDWEKVDYHERTKQSYEIMRRAFLRIGDQAKNNTGK
ncbi:hypothetical protein ACI7RC_03360 [Brevibacillus sp. B_LB10_24]|uniref:hypothetical protein n=1 Tax=Brevibacillus sp. B_LB10_24 TaxID=3380645 RepID=UPI0038BACB9A